MSNGVNKVILLGNLGADPEFRGGATDVLKLRLATTESWADKNGGARQEKTEWHTCTVFGARAAALAKLLHKGERVYIEGGLRTTSYDKDGETRYRTEIVVRELVLCGGGGGGGGRSRPEPSPEEASDQIPF